MGMLVYGEWVDDAAKRRGGFRRPDAPVRNWVTADGSSGFKAEAGRYHLYISYACPWAHRALIVRHLKKLEDAVTLSVVDWHMTDDGWHFSDRDGWRHQQTLVVYVIDSRCPAGGTVGLHR